MYANYKIFGLLDVKVSEGELKDENRCTEILKMVGKYDEYTEILNFMKLANRDNINRFKYKIQNMVGRYVSSRDGYKSLDADKLKQELLDIKKALKYKKSDSFYLHSKNSGKKFLSVDIYTANFSCLKTLFKGSDNAIDSTTTWPEYFKTVFPNDVRADGTTTDIPDSIYRSKNMRLMALSELTKLPYVWEKINFELVKKYYEIEKILDIKRRVYINQDEFVIELDSYEQGDMILSKLEFDENVHRARMFELKSIIEAFGKNMMLKIYKNGKRALVNIPREHYNDMYKKYLVGA